MHSARRITMILSILALSQFAMATGIDSPNSEEFPNQCQFYYNGTILPHPLDCHKFIVCHNSKSQEYNCQFNYYFDKNSRSCKFGNACPNNNDTLKPSLCQEGNVIPVTDNCYMFETCVRGQYQKLNCASGYYFSLSHFACQPIHYNVDYKCNCLLPERSVLENKENCQTYFVCNKHQAWVEKCPANHYYEAKKNTCMPDSQGVCVMQPTKEPPREMVTKLKQIPLNWRKGIFRNL